MRRKLVPWILGVCTLSAGCGPIFQFTRTMIIEPTHYCLTEDKVGDWCGDHRLAKLAWEKYVNCHGSQEFSDHFADGFRDGYSDFLFAGGNGLPPPLPPRHYW